MTVRRMTPLLAGLLGATVLTPAAFAQTSEELATQGQSCEALRALHTEASGQLREEWIETTQTAVDAGDQAQCQTYYDQAVAELAQLGADGAPERTEGQETAQQPSDQPTAEQTAQAGAEAQGEGCEALQTLATQETDRLREEWVTQAQTVVQAGDAAQCQTLFDQARAELAQVDSGQGADASAEIVVLQPDPEVQVTQPPPEVTVTNPQPQVTVDQGQPQVLVRQAPPNVRVQVPQPIITIEQPPPEIIITMPDPQVAVTNPEPQVTVRQAQPTVRVEQAEPQVRVEQAEGGDGQANVQVQPSEEAQVQLQETEGEAQVEVTQQEPEVQFEAAEPNVTVEQVGEAEVQFSQTGEPVITFQQGEGGAQQAAGAQPTQPADAPAAGEVGNVEPTQGELEGQPAGEANAEEGGEQVMTEDGEPVVTQDGEPVVTEGEGETANQ